MPAAMAVMPITAAVVIVMRCRAVAMCATFGRSFTHLSSSRHLHDLTVGGVQACRQFVRHGTRAVGAGNRTQALDG